MEYCPDVPRVLVGLQKDLRDDPAAQEEMRKRGQKFVSREDVDKLISSLMRYEEGNETDDDAAGQRRAPRRKNHQTKPPIYLECSSLTGEGVDDVFEVATRQSLLTGGPQGNRSCCVIL
jgi:Rho family, other